MLRKSMQFFSAFLLTALLLGGGSLSSPVALAAEQVLPEVYAGGQTIGILLKSQGVTVVGLAPVTEQDGQTTNPAETAGIKIGDFIITINGKEITGDEQLSALIDRAGQEGQNCQIEFLRNGEKKNAEITPLFSQDTGGYRIGLYVRDNMAGVGTLTFYEPQSGLYGALGHEVDNAHLAQDGTALGQIIKAPISGIRVAESGAPGEKIGVFIGNPTGTITKNSIYGLFGKCKQLPDPLYLRNPIPVA
ncbi:MAG: SpoIVB peptidase S55 domain-containing protein, partial [Clostridiales bacterium]